MRFFKAILAAAALSLLAACAEHLVADPADLARARHVSDEQPYVALMTMVNRSSGNGAHSALVINASERVIYDPAGTFHHDTMPETGDVHFGATDRMLSYYERFHARFSHYVHIQRVNVSAEIAELIFRRTKEMGAQPKLFCTQATTRILREVPGFTHIEPTFYPENLREDFAAIPGVIDRYREEEDREKVVPTD